MRLNLAVLVVATLPCAAAVGGTATYKFVGAPLVINNGACLTKKDKIRMTLVFASDIQQQHCNTSAPLSMTITDGVHKQTFKPAYFNGATFDLCKLQHGNTVDTWVVQASPLSKSGGATFFVFLTNPSSVYDEITDYLCAPVGMGSSGAPGKWTGP